MFEDTHEWLNTNGPSSMERSDDPFTRSIGFKALAANGAVESWSITLTGLKKDSCEWAQEKFKILRSGGSVSSIESFGKDIVDHASSCEVCLASSVHET